MKKQMLNLMAIFAMILMGPLAAQAVPQASLEGKINFNSATADELMLLPGIGEVKAGLIIEARSAKPFANREDLLNVKGIGEKLLDRWGSYIAFEGPTTLKLADGTSSTPKTVDGKNKGVN